jgi:hypothetical protein
MRLPLLSLLLLAALPAFGKDTHNTLTEAEKAAGWQLLFDGSSLQGWHAIGASDATGTGWSAGDGELRLRLPQAGEKTAHKDLLTAQEFSDFELTWEWNIAPAGNSGVKYNLPDKTKAVGCEYQMIDDERHADAKVAGGSHKTAALYDILPPTDAKVKPAGEWNQSRIVVKGNHVEQYLNGGKTIEVDFGSDALKELIAKSKFKTTKGWGEKTVSPILLQDHGNEVTFRDIKIRAPKP